jgi:DNA-binding transcriptional LysR family regulator
VTFGALDVPNVLGDFHAAHPIVRIRLTEPDRLVCLHDVHRERSDNDPHHQRLS